MTTLTDIIKQLTDNSMETRLLKPRLIRQLYKSLGEPTREQFPEPFSKASYFRPTRGYTTTLPPAITTEEMQAYNTSPTDWCIRYPSSTKCSIVDKYVRDGWHAVVTAYVVTVSKIVPHPQYPDIAVRFTITRDTATYEYFIITD